MVLCLRKRIIAYNSGLFVQINVRKFSVIKALIVRKHKQKG